MGFIFRVVSVDTTLIDKVFRLRDQETLILLRNFRHFAWKRWLKTCLNRFSRVLVTLTSDSVFCINHKKLNS